MLINHWFSHPYVSKSGNINYIYLSYPCLDSKMWAVIGDALRITIPKICDAINRDMSLTMELKTKAECLYNDFLLIFSPTPHNFPEATMEEHHYSMHSVDGELEKG